MLESFGIVQPQNLYVRNEKSGALHGRQHLREGRYVSARKYVFRYPGVGDVRALRSSNRMEQHHSVVVEQLCTLPEERVVEPHSDVLEHSYRDDSVEAAGYIAIILQPKFEPV